MGCMSTRINYFNTIVYCRDSNEKEVGYNILRIVDKGKPSTPHMNILLENKYLRDNNLDKLH